MSEHLLNADRKDCLQEIINVAMGKASDKLARYIDMFVHLKVPNIELVKSDLFPDILTQKSDNKHVYVVSQGFYGEKGIRGEALLVYPTENVEDITALLGYGGDSSISDNEQLTDLSAILTTTFLNSWATQLENSLSYTAPRIITSGENDLGSQLKQLSSNWDLALKVDISYLVTDIAFNCEMVLLIPGQAIENIVLVLDDILAEY